MSNKPFPFSVCKECCENETKELHAKDIACTDDWVDGENVQEAIDYLGKEKDRIFKLAWDNKGRLDKAADDIEQINNDVETHTTDIGLLRDDLASRPTAEEEKQAITDVENINKRVDELEEQTRESFADLDAEIKGNKTLTDVALIDLEQRSHNIFANALKGSATGETITLKDTSPVEHIMDVKVRKKNLLPYPYRDFPDGVGQIEKNGLTIAIDNKGAITLNGTATATIQLTLCRIVNSLPIGVKQGDTITISKNCNDETQQSLVTFTFNYFDINGKQTSGLAASTKSSASKKILDTWVGCFIYLYISKDTTLNNLTIKPQIELGSVATGWSPYLAEDISTVKLLVEETDTEYTVNEDGTVTDVKSIYPNMTLSTDTVGAVIDVEYNRDINKAFAELANAIISLGGNI